MAIRFFAAALLMVLTSIPATCLAGSIAWGTDSHVEGGSIISMAIDPANSATAYAGTVGGGVFKTIDNGDHWSSLAVFRPIINSLAVDPQTTANI